MKIKTKVDFYFYLCKMKRNIQMDRGAKVNSTIGYKVGKPFCEKGAFAEEIAIPKAVSGIQQKMLYTVTFVERYRSIL